MRSWAIRGKARRETMANRNMAVASGPQVRQESFEVELNLGDRLGVEIEFPLTRDGCLEDAALFHQVRAGAGNLLLAFEHEQQTTEEIARRFAAAGLVQVPDLRVDIGIWRPGHGSVKTKSHFVHHSAAARAAENALHGRARAPSLLTARE